MPKPIPVVCAIIEQNGKFLAAQRGKGQSNAKLWEFPGGKVHPGESPRDALRREIEEELGIKVEIGAEMAPVIHEYSWISIELKAFICQIKSGAPVPTEHSQIRFIDAKEAESLQWAPADIPILERYLKTAGMAG